MFTTSNACSSHVGKTLMKPRWSPNASARGSAVDGQRSQQADAGTLLPPVQLRTSRTLSPSARRHTSLLQCFSQSFRPPGALRAGTPKKSPHRTYRHGVAFGQWAMVAASKQHGNVRLTIRSPRDHKKQPAVRRSLASSPATTSDVALVHKEEQVEEASDDANVGRGRFAQPQHYEQELPAMDMLGGICDELSSEMAARLSVWIGGIPQRDIKSTVRMLTSTFGDFGTVMAVHVRPKEGENKTWAFVTFLREQSVAKVIEAVSIKDRGVSDCRNRNSGGISVLNLAGEVVELRVDTVGGDKLKKLLRKSEGALREMWSDAQKKIVVSM